jgi:hypothetical protein
MPVWLKIALPTLVRRVLPVVAGAVGALLVDYGFLDQQTVEAVVSILEGN